MKKKTSKKKRNLPNKEKKIFQNEETKEQMANEGK